MLRTYRAPRANYWHWQLATIENHAVGSVTHLGLLLRLQHLTDYEQSDVVFSQLREHIIGNTEHPETLDLQTRFL